MNIVPLLYVRIRKFCKEKNMEVSDIRHMTFVISLKKKPRSAARRLVLNLPEQVG